MQELERLSFAPAAVSRWCTTLTIVRSMVHTVGNDGAVIADRRLSSNASLLRLSRVFGFGVGEKQEQMGAPAGIVGIAA